MNLRNFRPSYKLPTEALDEEFSKIRVLNPLETFKSWFSEAKDIVPEANAMCLSTCGKNGQPSSRFVLLKGVDDKGLQFFTNYKSKKGHQMDENRYVSAVFYWEPLHRSVRFEGQCSKLSDGENREYFSERCRGSQISALISRQSLPVKDRKTLIELCEQYENEAAKNVDSSLKCPDHWGGYNLRPTLVELWQGQTDRLHDRFLFRAVANLLTENNCDEETALRKLLKDNEWSNLTEDKLWLCQRLFP